MTGVDSTTIFRGRMRWAPGGRLTPDEPGRVARPQIIDSWLLNEGKVRALDRHEARFAHGCNQLMGESANESVRHFLAAVRAGLPRRGLWFPRLEANRSNQLTLWLRPAPPLQTSTVLWVPASPDPRQWPTLKGPDLAVLTKLSQQANQVGADDALLYLTDGTVLETSRAALLWWRGSTLCLPDQQLPMLRSVTVELLVELARRHGVTVRYEHCHLAELIELPVWTANALHGLRRVCQWIKCPNRGLIQAAPSLPLHPWHEALQASGKPLAEAVGHTPLGREPLDDRID
jgi:branched-subunit amino acid aminotransferase/4-amino-4-deoxychorismate lyase